MSCELLEIPHKLAPYIVEKKKRPLQFTWTLALQRNRKVKHRLDFMTTFNE